MKNYKDKIKMLKEYFEKNQDILMAFLFGSYATGNQISESDIDIAVYFTPTEKKIEWEEEKTYKNENIIWNDIEEIAGVKTDFIVLNRAPSNLAFSIIQDGIPIIIKDPAYFLRFFLCISSAAEDFRKFTKDFWEIKQRSASISEIDKSRLIYLIDFLKSELNDYTKVKNIINKEYETDSYKRRNVERWVENIVNSSIDIAKVLLASEGRRLPQTYRLILNDLAYLEEFNEEIAIKLSKNSKLRNILAHEYMDIRFNQIKEFLIEPEKIYGYLIDYVQKVISK
jgi:uncharacterized protein YutE (UPF0331/DUF86 family)/predicted nucleotidyltransferase